MDFYSIPYINAMLGFLLVCLLLNPALSLDNGLARTPPMGWLSWTRFRCNTNFKEDPDYCISEKLIKETADRMVSDGYLEAGYEYVSLDDCWLAMEREPITNKLQPDPDRFPSGIKALADYVHSKGLKFGIYGDYGTKTCAGYPGNKDFLKLDAETYAEWGVDLLKLDQCNVDAKEYIYGFPAMAMFLNQTGRPILFSCGWPYGNYKQNHTTDYAPVKKYCNTWRNFKDVRDNFASIMDIVNFYGKNNVLFRDFSGPGGYFDPDMLVAGNFASSIYQQQAQMAMWAMFSAPLIMSNDLRDIRPESKELLLNRLLISVDQDPLGKMATKIYELDGLQIWTKPIMPKGSLAVTFFNTKGYGSGVPIRKDVSPLGLTDPRGYDVTEVFTGKHLGIMKPGSYLKARIYPTSAYMIVCKLMQNTHNRHNL